MRAIDTNDKIKTPPRIKEGNRRGEGNPDAPSLKANIKKCFFCKKDFDIVVEGFRMPRVNRYSHNACYEANFNEDETFVDEIYQYLREEVNLNYDYAACERQRVSYIKNLGYTNEGILKTLKYWYGYKKEDPSKAGCRIGIVTHIYDEAQRFYKHMEQKQKEIKKTVAKQIETDEMEFFIKSPPPQQNRKRNQIDLNTIEGGVDD